MKDNIVDVLRAVASFPDIIKGIDDYDSRKVANTHISIDGKERIIDTCYTHDTKKFETGIKIVEQNDGNWIIVEEYDDIVMAKRGHERWVKMMRKKNPPLLKDVSTCPIKKAANSFIEK